MKYSLMVVSVLTFSSLMVCLWLWGLPLSHVLILLVAFLVGCILLHFQSLHLIRLTKAMEELNPKEAPVVLNEKGLGNDGDAIRAFNNMSERVYLCQKERELFLAEICHDLRVPLARIRLASEMLSESELILAKGIIQDTEESSLIINQITDFARPLDKGLSVRVNINLLIREVIDATLRCGSCRLDTELNESMPAVLGDPVSIRRAITNLINNACRYGNGRIKVSSSFSSDKSHIWICVEDNGPGIEESEFERLIQPFERGQHSGSSSGLGLAIVRRIVNQHSGEFSVCNRTDGGLKASFSIPYTDN